MAVMVRVSDFITLSTSPLYPSAWPSMQLPCACGFAEATQCVPFTYFQAHPSLLSPILLVGDFNVRHPLWGNTVTSPRAADLLGVTSQFSLSCLNSGLPTHYSAVWGSFSCIDLAFCSTSVLLDFSWFLLDCMHGSNHFPILVSEVSPEPPSSPQVELPSC